MSPTLASQVALFDTIQPPTATTIPMPGTVPSDCAGFSRPALVLIPSLAQRTDPASLILTSPDGSAHCTLTPPDVPWSSYNCQVVGERVYYWPELAAALQTLDVRSGRLDFLDLAVAPAYQFGNFLVSPDENWIVWSVGQSKAGESHSAFYLARMDGSEQRVVLDEHYDDLRRIWPVAWAPASDTLFFARQLLVEGGGTALPAFQGRYSNLYRFSVETGEVNKVIPLDEGTDCRFCVADISPDGRWLAYHHKDGALYLRDLDSGDETYVSAGHGDWVAGARFSPDGSHLAYVEVQGHDQPRFAGARTILVNAPLTEPGVIVSEHANIVDWPVGWLDGETLILERGNAEGNHLGLWVAGSSQESDDLLPGILGGVLYSGEEN